MIRTAFATLALVSIVIAVSCVRAADADTDAPATAPTSRPAAHKPVQVGDGAPTITLKTLDQHDLPLEQAWERGPLVLVMLRGWPGYQCPICTKQVADLMSHAADMEQAGANVVLVYPGPASDLDAHAKEFVSGKSLPDRYWLVTDPDFKMTELYGLRWNEPKETAYPSTFVIDGKGIVKFAKISKSHGGRASFDEIKKALDEVTKE